MSTLKCGCVYADSNNTSSVRKGYEMGGYLKTPCHRHGNSMGDNVVGCRICNAPTRMFGTKLCDRCWELETRIKHDPELARQILADMEKD
jgi:hypothetical protein